MFLSTGDVNAAKCEREPSKKLMDTETRTPIPLQILFGHPGIYLADKVKKKMQESTGLSVSLSLICVEAKEL